MAESNAFDASALGIGVGARDTSDQIAAGLREARDGRRDPVERRAGHETDVSLAHGGLPMI